MIRISSKFYNYNFGYEYLYQENMKHEYFRAYRDVYTFTGFSLRYSESVLKNFSGNGFSETREEGFDYNLIFYV